MTSGDDRAEEGDDDRPVGSPDDGTAGGSPDRAGDPGEDAGDESPARAGEDRAEESPLDEDRTTESPLGIGEDTEPSPPLSRTADDDDGLLHRFLTARHGPLMFLREMLTSALVVLAIGLLLFAISGVWPPMVAVQSGSMEPNMEKGDLVFVTEPGRLAPDAAVDDTGVVPLETGRETEYRSFGGYGSVIVYHEPNSLGPPIIHRAHFYVEDGENWYDRANDEYHTAENCGELPNCPAPHAGFVTKGDNNRYYDQVRGIAPPVRQAWLNGVARVRVPYLGWIRLVFTGAASTLPGQGTTIGAAGVSAVVAGGLVARRQ